MIEGFPKIKSKDDRLSERRLEIRRIVSAAIEGAVSHSEIEAIRNQIDQLEKLLLAGSISSEDYNSQIKALNQINDHAGVVTVDTLNDFSMVLNEAGIKGDYRDRVINHENSHGIAAMDNGLKFHYKIQFVKLPNGGMGFLPSVVYFYPEDASMNERARIRENITSAPDDLSNRDKSQLGISSDSDRDIFDK